MEKERKDQQLEHEALDGFVTERELIEEFGIQKGPLDNLRRRSQFPYVAVSQRVRLYYKPDVRDWLLRRRQNLPRTQYFDDVDGEDV
jgi:8-oxo-dGTP pyrophosphatase MutT (NUDIX family)